MSFSCRYRINWLDGMYTCMFALLPMQYFVRFLHHQCQFSPCKVTTHSHLLTEEELEQLPQAVSVNTTHFDLLEFDTELDFSNKIGYDWGEHERALHRRAKHVKICMYVCSYVCLSLSLTQISLTPIATLLIR